MKNLAFAKHMQPVNRISPHIYGRNHKTYYFPTVVQVMPLDNFHVQVFFDDGKIDPFTVYELEAINNLIA